MSTTASGFRATLLLLLCFALFHSDASHAAGKQPASPPPKKERNPAAKASPVPTYTNDDLKSRSATGGDEAEVPAAAEGQADSSSGELYGEGSGEGNESPLQLEEIWRSRAQEARAAIAGAETAVLNLEEEAKDLGGRILMSTDTYEILDLRRQQQVLSEQIEQARRSVVDAKQAQDDLETEARRAGVLPGWLREP